MQRADKGEREKRNCRGAKKEQKHKKAKKKKANLILLLVVYCCCCCYYYYFPDLFRLELTVFLKAKQ
jgi:hypothetical protein